MKTNTILTYTILNKIGEGGMGSVYLANHNTLYRKAAIKVLNPELTSIPEIKSRFSNEAITLSRLNHHNIVTLYDFTEVDGELYLIMEYVEGKTLDKILESSGRPVEETELKNIFNQVLDGFSYAHKSGVIHRDIKPSNIMVTESNTVKILDFGIAKILQSSSKLTKTGTRIGSLFYMSPEQILARDVDKRSDIYSLGITLYELASGRIPFRTNTESEYEIQSQIINDPILPLRQVNPSASEMLESVINKAIAKNPDDRFGSCEEFKDALSNHSSVNVYNKTTVSDSLDRTSIASPHQQYTNSEPQKNKNRNLILALSGGVLILIFAVFLIIGIAGNSGTDSNNKVTETNKNENSDRINSRTEPARVTITESEARDIISQWQQSQNSIDIPKYLSFYAEDFYGIKRTTSGKQYNMDYNSWANDRRVMYSKAAYLNVGCDNIKVTELNSPSGTAKVTFLQTYLSTNKAGKSYDDQGKKIIKLRKDESGKIKIIYEELIYSTNVEYGD